MSTDESQTAGSSVENTDRDDSAQPVTAQQDQAIGVSLAYGLIVSIRVSGVARLVRSPDPRNPLAVGPLAELGQFVFYDGFVLALLGFASSLVLLAAAWSDPAGEQTASVQQLASLGVGLASLGYLVGSLLVVLG